MAVAADLVLVGGGKMGEALLLGALRAGWCEPQAVVVVELSEGRQRHLSSPDGVAGHFPGVTIEAKLPAEVTNCIVAVKPGDVEAVCRALAGRATRRVLSIAAGLSLSDLEEWCPNACAVVRAMPNLAATAQASATAISPGTAAGPDDVSWASGVLGAVGTVVEVPEHLLDAVTGVSGSGPAYLMVVAEALAEGGVLMGLPRVVAEALAAQTLLGAGRLLEATGQAPAELRAAVTSPGGTTAAGLRALEAAGVRSAFIEAVAAATGRSRQLGHERH